MISLLPFDVRNSFTTFVFTPRNSVAPTSIDFSPLKPKPLITPVFPSLPSLPGRRGLTLVESLVVIAIIGLLAAVLLPVFSKIRYPVRITKCVSNLRQIHTAFELYAADNNNYYPPVRVAASDQNYPHFLREYIPTKNRYGGGQQPNIYLCPEKLNIGGHTSASHYGVNRHLYDAQGGLANPLNKLTIADPSRTILLADTRQLTSGIMSSTIGNGNPPGTVQGPTPLQFKHANGSANILHADGHVAFFENTYILNEARYRNGSADDLWSAQK